MPFIDHKAISEIQMRPGIRGRFLANRELGATGIAMLLNTVDPGVAVPLHMHTVEEGVVVYEGSIWMRVGDQRYTVGANDVATIPARTPHAWGNSGPEVARMLWVWSGNDPFRDATYLEGEPPKQH